MAYYESLEFRNKMRGKRTRTVSSPDNTQMLRKMLENIQLEKGRNHSNDQTDPNVPLDLSDDPMFKRYQSDTSLEDYASLMNTKGKIDILTKHSTGMEGLIKKCEEESVIGSGWKKSQDVFECEDLNLRELFCEVIHSMGNVEECKHDIFDWEDLNLRELFCEDGIDYTELHKLVEEERKNKLYGIYKKLNMLETASQGTGIQWEKRKNSQQNKIPHHQSSRGW